MESPYEGEGIPEEALLSGVQIQQEKPVPNEVTVAEESIDESGETKKDKEEEAAVAEEEDEDGQLYLGDRIQIDSKKYGRTLGRI